MIETLSEKPADAIDSSRQVAPARRLDALTGARFIAAAGVVWIHAEYTIGDSLPEPLRRTGLGGLGVAFFFMLSGFILTYNYAETFSRRITGERLAAFYRARFARIYPAYLFLLLAYTPVVLYLISRRSAAIGSAPYGDGRKIAASWIMNALMLQAHVPSQTIQNLWNSPGWSVSCEVLFYALFPLIALALARVRTSAAIAALGLCALALEGLASYLLSIHAPLSWQGAIGSMMLERFPLLRTGEFALGCCVGALFLRQRRTISDPAQNWIAAAGLAMLLCLILARELRVFFAVPFHVVSAPVFALLIWILAGGKSAMAKVLSSPSAVLLGEASYSLYLIHWLPLILLIHHYGRFKTPIWIGLSAFALCVPLAILVFLFVERPMRAMLRGRSRPRHVAAPAEAAAR